MLWYQFAGRAFLVLLFVGGALAYLLSGVHQLKMDIPPRRR